MPREGRPISTENNDERRELIDLVNRLMSGQFSSEEEEDRAIATLVARVPHPNPTNLVFHWHGEFDSEPTAGEIVDRALAYRSIEL